MDKPLISVIVPVYNVEQYLDRCLESIVKQTYTNLEIILVDDGSPDNCPAICDSWAEKDSRIIVIHKENDGLANARNSGIEFCSGDYVLFADSDDYLDLDMVEFLYNLSSEYNADVSRCGFYTENEITGVQSCPKYDGSIKVFNYEERLKDLLSGNHVSGVAWNKLYKANVIKNHLYDKSDGCSEDIMHNYRVCHDINLSVVCDIPKYHYVIRSNSITNNEFGIGAFDIIRAKRLIINDEKNNCAIYQYAVKSFISSAIIVISGCVQNNALTNECDDLINEVLSYKKTVLKSNNYSFVERARIIVLSISPKLYKRLIKWKYTK